MNENMRHLVIAALVVVGVIFSLGVAFALYANSEFTECYGMFESRDAAEGAAEAGRDAGLGVYVEHRRSESAVTFDSGETGGDAAEARRAFREIVTRWRGALGHPDGGCTERGPFH